MSDEVRLERRRRRVIVTVDDEPDQRRLIALMLGMRCEVHQAATSEEALELVAKHEVEYVLTDSNLPNFDGFQLCRHLRGRYMERHAIIFVTASGDQPEVRKKIQDVGANAIVTKPFRRMDLIHALRETRPALRSDRHAVRLIQEIQANLGRK